MSSARENDHQPRTDAPSELPAVYGRTWWSSHVIASYVTGVVVFAVFVPGMRFPEGTSRVQGYLVLPIMFAAAPILVPALLVGVPIVAAVKAQMPSVWLFVYWATYVVSYVISQRVPTRRKI